MIYGPLAHTVKKTSDLNESTARIYNLFVNSSKDAELPPNGLYLYADPRVSQYCPDRFVNVRLTQETQEVAAAHTSAIFTPEAGGNRFIICGGQISSQQISDTLRAEFPELEGRTPIGKPGVSSLPEEGQRYDASSEKAKKVLGIRFRSVEDTLKDLGAQLLKLEKHAD